MRTKCKKKFIEGTNGLMGKNSGILDGGDTSSMGGMQGSDGGDPTTPFLATFGNPGDFFF